MDERRSRGMDAIGARARSGGPRAHPKRDRPRADRNRDLALRAQQALERELAEHLVDGVLDEAQHGADRAVAVVQAALLDAGVAVAERGGEEAASEGPERGPPRPLPGGR